MAGGLLTAAIMWDDDDDWNDRLYYGGPGNYGGPSYWGQPNYWNNNGWREPANINVDRTRNLDIDRNVERGDINVNSGIVGNEVKKWEHNPERRGGVRYRDASTENKFAAKRGEATIDRDAARGRMKSRDRQVKAPNLDQVRREGAARRLSKLAARAERGASRPGGDVRRCARCRRKARRRGRGPQGSPPQAANIQAKPRVQARPAAAAKTTGESRGQTPRGGPRSSARRGPSTDPSAAPGGARASAPKASAFKASEPAPARAASNRGGASRAAARPSVAGAARQLGVAEAAVDADERPLRDTRPRVHACASGDLSMNRTVTHAPIDRLFPVQLMKTTSAVLACCPSICFRCPIRRAAVTEEPAPADAAASSPRAKPRCRSSRPCRSRPRMPPSWP